MEKGNEREVRSAGGRIWAVIAAEIIACYLLIYFSAWHDWPWHQYFRFLTLIPIYQAGVTYGFSAAVVSATAVSVLFFPVLRIDRALHDTPGGLPMGIAMIVFINVFGVFVGGLIGRSKKTHMYMRALSGVTLRIAAGTGERDVMLRLAREARAFVSARHSAVLVFDEANPDPAQWRMFEAAADDSTSEIPDFPPDHPLVWAARENDFIVTNSAASDPRFAAHPKDLPTAPAMVLPVSTGGAVYGSLFLHTRIDDELFSVKDLAVARALCGAAAVAINNIRQERGRQERKAEEERMGELFSKFVSPQVADYILNNPEALHTRWQEVTLLVSDIRGFTSISEQLPPEQLVKQLNEYFTAAVEVIFANGGAVDKFIGDCIVAYWGAPAPDPDHALHAARAAAGMAAAADALNARWTAEGRPAFSAGIALHTGKALMGNVGNESKKSFTIAGGEVETAIGLEGRTKGLGERIIASGSAAAAIGAAMPLELIPETAGESPLYALKI